MNTEDSKFKIAIAFVTVCLVWGSTWLAIKIGLASVPPLLSIAARFGIAAAVIFPIIRLRNIPIPLTPNAKSLYLNLVVFSFTVPFALVYWSEQYLSSGLTSILFSTYPFWVAIFSQFMLVSESLNGFKIAGILLGFVGTTIIFAGDVNILESKNTLAMFAVAACPVMQAYSLIVTKKLGQPIHPLVLNGVGMGASVIPLFAASLAFESYSSIVWDTKAIGSILYLGIVGSVVVFAAYYWLLKRTEAVLLSFTSFITPVISVILGMMVLGESFDRNTFIGAAFVLVGVVAANGKYIYRRMVEVVE